MANVWFETYTNDFNSKVFCYLLWIFPVDRSQSYSIQGAIGWWFNCRQLNNYRLTHMNQWCCQTHICKKPLSVKCKSPLYVKAQICNKMSAPYVQLCIYLQKSKWNVRKKSWAFSDETLCKRAYPFSIDSRVSDAISIFNQTATILLELNQVESEIFKDWGHQPEAVVL